MRQNGWPKDVFDEIPLDALKEMINDQDIDDDQHPYKGFWEAHKQLQDDAEEVTNNLKENQAMCRHQFNGILENATKVKEALNEALNPDAERAKDCLARIDALIEHCKMLREDATLQDID